MIKKPLFTRFENLLLTPPPNGESGHPQAAVICGPSQNVYDGEKKVQKKYSCFRENRGKTFFFGGNFTLNGWKAVKKKSSVVYGSKSTRCSWFENVNFQRKFSNVSRFYVRQLCCMLSSPHDSPFILVLCISRSLRNSDGVTPCRGAKYRWGIKIARFSTNKSVYLANDTRYRHGCYGRRIGTHMRSIKWCHFQ